PPPIINSTNILGQQGNYHLNKSKHSLSTQVRRSEVDSILSITHNIPPTSFRPTFFLPALCKVSLLHKQNHPIARVAIFYSYMRQPAPCREQACFYDPKEAKVASTFDLLL